MSSDFFVEPQTLFRSKGQIRTCLRRRYHSTLVLDTNPAASEPSFVNALSAEPSDVRLEFLDLRFQTLAVRAVLSRVDRLPLEGRVFEPKHIHLATEAFVLGLNILMFAFAHELIVARCGRFGGESNARGGARRSWPRTVRNHAEP
jgi:hypothetical protein